MTQWNSFYPHVLIELPGCSMPLVDHAIRDAAREFCKRSSFWMETEEFQADGSVGPYGFDIPTQAELIKIVSAKVGDDDLAIYSSDKLPKDWQINLSWLRQPCIVQASIDEYMLYPTPGAGQNVAITISLRPTIDAGQCGDIVFEQYAEAIASGAKYRLQKMSNKPWSDAGSAAVHFQLFEDAVHEAANTDFRQTATAQRRVKTY